MAPECAISSESAQFVSNFQRSQQPAPATYHPSNRNHPNFSLSNNQGYNQPQQGFQQGPKQYNQAGNSQQYAPKQPYHPPGFQNHGQSANERPQGNLPSDTEVPGKRDPKEQVQSITLRSGRTTTGTTSTLVQDKGDEPQEIPAEVPSNTLDTNSTVEKDKAIPAAAPMSNPVYPPPPFPRRLKKQQLDKQFALEQMPSYAKFMKGILSKKLKLEELETVALTEECSACLCDLGASINLMPLSIFTQLGLPELKPTNMSLQLADRSITYPRGIIEDVLVKVDQLIFPADFVILDFEEDKRIPIILGRPFLATGQTLIDVQKGELTMRIQNQTVTFNVFNAMKLPTDEESCFSVDVLDTTTEANSQRVRKRKNF
ncbi:uncharacterized protein LOC135147930 [Daucus carota subsp. sativus]|uniref:uncharacterized protein LOC135147930 n=1 Tax=Daucus carota subsp. sativus TaxID=79200 RepID=UPI00308380F0